MLDEKKGTCCHKCGHVHVKGTSCPTPFLKGEKSCARRANEMHTMKHDGADEHHQLRADIEEALKGLWANIRAKRARGEKPARKGSEAYNKAKQAAEKINAMDEAGPIERFVIENQSKRQVKEERTGISPQVQAFLDECNRIIGILRDDELFQKERQKHKNDPAN